MGRRRRAGPTRSTSRRSARSTGASATPSSPCSRRKGLRLAGGDATFFLWLAVDGPSEAFARRLLDAGILVAPGSVLRRRRRGLCEDGARADRRTNASAPPRSSRPRCDHDRGDDCGARPRRDAGRRADGDDWKVNAEVQGGDPRLLPLAEDGAARGRAVRVPRQDPAQVRATRSSACASSRRRWRGTASFLSPRRRPDALAT